jgi:hypothetical protein
LFLLAPLFIFQWQFDKFQLYANNVAIPASRDQWKYIHQALILPISIFSK